MIDSKKRIGYYDIAKAIAVSFIVLAHFGRWQEVGGSLPPILSDMAYTFHVPLFFIVSGCFFSPAKPYSIKKEARSFLMPYGASCLIILFLDVARNSLFHQRVQNTDILIHWVKAALYGAGSPNELIPQVGSIGGLWFLLALFWAKMLLCLVHKFSSDDDLLIPFLSCIFLFALGLMLSQYTFLPFSIAPGLCAVLYLQIGYIIKARNLIEYNVIPIYLKVGMLIIWICVVFLYKGCYPVSNSYPNGIIDIIGAICGSICVLTLSKFIDSFSGLFPDFLRMYGRNTLVFFAMHIVDLITFPSILVQTYLLNEFKLPMALSTVIIHFSVPAILSLSIYILPRPLSGIYFPQRRDNGLL